MKKVVICSIPMKKNVEQTVYLSDDLSLPVSGEPYRYVVNSFLSRKVNKGDEYKFILLIKKDGNRYYQKNVQEFRKEAESYCAGAGVKTKYVLLDTAFSEERRIHEQLMGKLTDEIETESHIIADITYGPKDIPIVIFSALNFAERFLYCEIDNIIYGLAEFKENRVVRSVICDMAPLYCLSSVTNMIKCDDPLKARMMLKTLLSL